MYINCAPIFNITIENSFVLNISIALIQNPFPCASSYICHIENFKDKDNITLFVYSL